MIHGVVNIFPLGLFGSNGCGFAAVAEIRKKSGGTLQLIPFRQFRVIRLS